MDKIEIPFGAYDSETLGWTYTIPKGYTAKIEDGKIIVKKEELKDERIRKWIYNIISSLGDPQDEDAEKELEEMQPLALAYLEKQKDASKAIEAVDRIDKYIGEHVANAHDMKDSNPDKKYYRGWDDALAKMSGILQDVYSGEKQKEQRNYRKLYENIAKSEWFKKTYGGKSLGGDDEQKPAEWDDYTKTNLDRAIQIIKKAKGKLQGYQTDDGIYECDKAIEALEHFLYRGLEIEKSAEWSEEDEAMLDSIIAVIEDWENEQSEKEKEYYGATSKSDWLKSLRPPQYCENCKLKRSVENWKPSEEQMEALRSAVNKLAKTDVADSVRLSIMYDNLKKLM